MRLPCTLSQRKPAATSHVTPLVKPHDPFMLFSLYLRAFKLACLQISSSAVRDVPLPDPALPDFEKAPSCHVNHNGSPTVADPGTSQGGQDPFLEHTQQQAGRRWPSSIHAAVDQRRFSYTERNEKHYKEGTELATRATQ